MTSFAAIDFETADYDADSACAVGVVVAQGGRIVERAVRLIRPPRPQVLFTWVHGLTWADVAEAPTFADVWPELEPLVAGVDFLAAHNARFDRGVMAACCAAAGLSRPRQRWVCTVEVARAAWRLRPAKLPDVCRFLAIPLRHHDPGSDAEACARIVLAAIEDGMAV